MCDAPENAHLCVKALFFGGGGGSQDGVAVIIRASHLCEPGSILIWFVRGLNFSRSQSDSEGFFPVLRFSSLLKIDSQLITSGCVVLCSEIIHGPYSGCQRRHDYAFDPISRAAFFGLQVRVISTADVNCLCFFINTFWEYCRVTGLPRQTPPNQRLCGAQ